MDLLHNLGIGFGVAFTFQNLMYAFFGAMLEPLGLALTVPALIIISSLAGDEFHWKGVAVAAIVLTVGSWAIFVWGLKLTIPVWPWFAR